MSHEMLETVLVQRHSLVDTVVDRVRSSATGIGKHHSLLVGPRGIGKTHIVSLVYHRVKAMEDLSDKLLIAWLREDEWGISTVRDLLIQILRALAAEYKDSGLEEKVESLYAHDAARAEHQAGEILKEYVDGRALLVFMENLDEMFASLGNTGQERFRSYIQENPFFTLLATSPSLFAGVQLRTSPFYGFFQVHHVEELSFDAAVELLAKVAGACDDSELAEFVKTPTGRARVRAVHHLGGGNPRIYTMFSQFLARTSLDDLTEAVMQTLEKLTPYYQSRMALLSTQQRKIVEYLIERRGAAPVKDIAKNCFATNQAVASQLKVLRDKGYVRSTTSGRESYYELREPLMRICIEVKKHLGEPIRLFVDFLRIWYSQDDLQNQATALAGRSALDQRYIAAALSAEGARSEDIMLSACWKDVTRYMRDGDSNHALEAVEEALSIRPNAETYVQRAIILSGNNRFDEALASVQHAVEMDPHAAGAMAVRGMVLNRLGRKEEGRAAIDQSLTQVPEDEAGWMYRGWALCEVGRYSEAALALDNVTGAGCQAWPVWFHKGIALCRTGRLRRALSSFHNALRLENTATMSGRIGQELHRSGHDEEAVAWFEKALNLDPQNVVALLWHAHMLVALGRYSEALASSEKVFALAPTDIRALMIHGNVLRNLKRYRDAMEVFRQAVAVAPGDANVWAFLGLTLLGVPRCDEALRSLEKALSLNHMNTLALAARPIALACLQRWKDVIVALDAAIPALNGDKNLQTTVIAGVGQRALFADCDPVQLEEILSDFASVAHRNGMIDALVAIVVASGALAFRSDMQLFRAKAALAVWTKVMSSEPVIETAVRMCSATIRYKETADERVFLELPQEERTLLRDLIDSVEKDQRAPGGEVPPDCD
jgi:tetratricopeptide (TPR) repeat protein